MDAAAFRPLADFQRAADLLAEHLKAVPPAPGFDEVLSPGEPELRMKERRQREGVPLPDPTWQAVVRTAAEVGVDAQRLVDQD